ncbi:MAG TPA: uroporphyrinogen decarboxylase family protein [Bryobacteraceae bacterium]|nr:uroporphyrinogen decarboxylase family protein [Bryobacteraceae bacterium]HOQ48049.1 uroporphyrinogen decarboxylase family protein [Bryobacteraceae bacterium]HPQ17350.1 uroporphyrinogen decarboxylase family protein [Bryobacteraceae bacterium]HPU74223.1 uroporphyrinogen decarboxylase family protein [Bryobacteraceae bacterium]
MTKRERVEAVYALKPADRIPFVPAIYEHKGALIGKSPSEICRSADLLYAGLMKELEVYDADMLVIGIDVYNVEAEALGCKVVYFEDSNDCPAVVEPVVHCPADLRRLGVPDPECAGRMPLYLEVADRLSREIGAWIIVRGAVTGPYSMAAELIGAEQWVLLTVDDPGFAREVIEFCARVTVEFGKAFLKRGVEPIIFDSRATPTLASPRVVKSLVLPVYRDYVIPELKAAGGRFLPLIIGGNTTSIIDDLIATGATQFLSDRPANLAKWCEKALAARVPVRANVDAVLVNRGPAAAVRRQAVEILKDFHAHPGFLLGCGVVAYDGNPEHVHAIRHVIDELAAGTLDFERELS